MPETIQIDLERGELLAIIEVVAKASWPGRAAALVAALLAKLEAAASKAPAT